MVGWWDSSDVRMRRGSHLTSGEKRMPSRRRRREPQGCLQADLFQMWLRDRLLRVLRRAGLSARDLLPVREDSAQSGNVAAPYPRGLSQSEPARMRLTA